MRKLILVVALFAGWSGTAFAGRFELVQLGSSRADQFLLDSQTGKIWRSVCAFTSANNSNPLMCDYTIWEPMDVIGITAGLNDIVKKIQSKQRDDTKKAE